jgi:diphosphomevalonate decarboxylase
MVEWLDGHNHLPIPPLSISRKATATAPSNLALIKYMGRKDEAMRLPAHGSVSMNLSGCMTTTTVEFSPEFAEDSLTIDGKQQGNESARAFKHIDRIRTMYEVTDRVKIVSHNTFPRSTGLSSSSSGFAALTMAAIGALGEELSEREFSILARLGSGSACRSIPDGFVEWKDGNTSDVSYGESIFPPEHWDLCDVVAVITDQPKKIASSDTHVAVRKSDLYAPRVANMPARIEACKEYLRDRNLTLLGPLIEQESLDLHELYESVGIVQRSPEARQLCDMTVQWRTEFPVYFSLNTGQNVHLICEGKDVEAVRAKLKTIRMVRDVIVNKPAKGARLAEAHVAP